MNDQRAADISYWLRKIDLYASMYLNIQALSYVGLYQRISITHSSVYEKSAQMTLLAIDDCCPTGKRLWSLTDFNVLYTLQMTSVIVEHILHSADTTLLIFVPCFSCLVIETIEFR